MRLSLSTVAGATILLLFLAAFATASAEEKPSKLRIGVYDSRAVVIGARDNTWFADVDDLRKQLKAAEAAGDMKKASQIKHRGQAMQQVRHLQGFSNAPVDDVIEHIKDRLPAIAAKAGVDVIVARPDFVAEGVEAIDITDQLVAALNPSEKTLKTVAEIKKHKPIPLLDALLIED